MRYLNLKNLIAALAITCLLHSCSKDNIIGIDQQDKLSDYGFFVGDLANLEPAEGVIPYDLNTPLFSDYAGKARFVYIPPGKTAQYTEDGVVEFPEGTFIIKNFFFLNDIRDASLGRKILETRILVKKDTGWDSRIYLWNEAQTEANFSVVGNVVPISWVHYDGTVHSTNYIIPNKNDCKSCHNYFEKLLPIGPKVRNLNKDYPYADGTMNQLAKWTALGMLTGAPEPANAPRMPVWNDPSTGSLDHRARAYLEANCAHCHNAHGPANNSGLLLNYEQADSSALGFCKLPIAAGQGAGQLRYDILAGKPDSSIMVYRMSSNVPNVAMPEVARTVIHEEGIQLIRDWIASFPATGCH